MRTRLALLATTTLAALAIATPAEAAGGGSWYASLTGGANWLNDNRFANTAVDTTQTDTDAFDFNNEPETGYVIAGAVGYSLGGMVPGLKVEAEVAFRQNEVGGLWTTVNDVTGTPTSDSARSTMTTPRSRSWRTFGTSSISPA